MPALARNQESNCGNPQLDIFTVSNNVLVDVALLEFQIFELVTTPGTPVQVYPAVAGTRQTVEVGTLCPSIGTGGAKIGTGHFVARWMPLITALIGTYRIKWFFKLTLASPERTMQEDFEVLSEVAGFPSLGYAAVSDLREEGLTTTDADDSRCVKIINLASRMVERWTGRFFEPRQQTLTLDGRGGRILQLGQPIIAVESVRIQAYGFDVGSLTSLELDTLRVYNRHLTQGLVQPDDRENPKLEWVHGLDLGGIPSQMGSPFRIGDLIWPVGQQNVELVGLFGYTDPDGSDTGKTPDMIRHVVKLLAMREFAKMRDVDTREDAQKRWRLTSETTRDQSYTLEGLRQVFRSGPTYTGDPEIDQIIASYRRPPIFAGT